MELLHVEIPSRVDKVLTEVPSSKRTPTNRPTDRQTCAILQMLDIASKKLPQAQRSCGEIVLLSSFKGIGV